MKPHLTEPPAIRWALTGAALAFLSLFLGVPLAAVDRALADAFPAFLDKLRASD